MTDRPILFSGPMVRAILAGTKTQTRRLVTEEWAPNFARSELFGYTKRPLQREAGRDDFVTFSEPYTRCLGEPVWFYSWGNTRWLRCGQGGPGDRLWVRETFATLTGNGHRTVYRADGDPPMTGPTDRQVPVRDMKWTPSIFMRREASRLTLEVTEVRVERLQSITEADAWAEGLRGPLIDRELDRIAPQIGRSSRESYAALWDSINGDRAPWSSNPWVWVVSFARVT